MTTITIDRATVEQALEALIKGCNSNATEWHQAIYALRAVLAQQDEPVEPVAHRVVAGALFDFMGWLTSRRERLVLSSTDDAAPAVDAIKDFAEMRGLSLDDAKVQDWNAALAQQAEPAQAISECIAVLRPMVKGKFPHEQALDELVGYTASPQRVAQQAEPVGQLAELQAMLRAEVDRLIAAGIQSQRKPLTDEEIESCRQKGYAHAGLGAPFDFGKAARAVEQASWEKNHGQA